MSKLKVPPIENFPNDDKLRVVWWYGPVKYNHKHPKLPFVIVALREIFDDKLSNYVITRIVDISALNIVRLSTIWKGKNFTGKIWNKYSKYFEKKKFTFNLRDESNIDTLAVRDLKSGIYFGHFLNKNFFEPFRKTRLTKLIDKNGKCILIPSLELFSSTYVPYNKIIRNLLVLHDIGTIIQELNIKAKEENEKYILDTHQNYNDVDLSFIAHLALNKTTKKRVVELLLSLSDEEYDEKGQLYFEKYPEVLPYNPSELEIIADGYDIDKNTKLILRINEFSLPQEYEIINNYHMPNVNGKGDDFDKRAVPVANNNKMYESENYELTSESEPHMDNPAYDVEIGIKVIKDKKPKIERNKIKDRSSSSKRTTKKDNKNEVKNISYGELNSRVESKETAPIEEVVNKSDKIEEECKFINDEDASENIDAIKSIIDAICKEKKFLNKYFFINSNAEICGKIVYCKIPYKELKSEEDKTWARKDTIKKIQTVATITTVIVLRNILVMKIIKKDGKYCYLLEIERKNKGEKFSGLLFSTTDGILTKATLDKLLIKICKERGHMKHLKNGKKTDIEFPKEIGKYFIFKHYEKHKVMRKYFEKKLGNLDLFI